MTFTKEFPVWLGVCWILEHPSFSCSKSVLSISIRMQYLYRFACLIYFQYRQAFFYGNNKVWQILALCGSELKPDQGSMVEKRYNNEKAYAWMKIKLFSKVLPINYQINRKTTRMCDLKPSIWQHIKMLGSSILKDSLNSEK